MSDNFSFYPDYFSRLSSKVSDVDSKDLNYIVELIQRMKERSKKIIIAGNGGSAAMASHVAVDFTKTAGIRAINFNEADLITCFANDFGYENWVAKALEMYADKGDLAILISSSGQSQNMILGAKKAKEMNLDLVTLSGFSGENPLRKLGQVNLWVDSNEYNIVEMSHHIWLVALVDFVIDSKN